MQSAHRQMSQWVKSPESALSASRPLFLQSLQKYCAAIASARRHSRSNQQSSARVTMLDTKYQILSASLFMARS